MNYSSQSLYATSILISHKKRYNLMFSFPAGNHLFKVNNICTRRCEICSQLTIKTPERRHWRHSGVFIVNFQHISASFWCFWVVLVSLVLTLNIVWHRSRVIIVNYEQICSTASIVNFEQVNAGWVVTLAAPRFNN